MAQLWHPALPAADSSLFLPTSRIIDCNEPQKETDEPDEPDEPRRRRHPEISPSSCCHLSVLDAGSVCATLRLSIDSFSALLAIKGHLS